MIGKFEKYKGIHPGVVVGRELKKRLIRQRPFALSIGEHPQTFNAITKGRRNITTALALKIEKELGMNEGTLLVLQAFYDIKMEKAKSGSDKPDLSKLRRALFWDTDIKTIDWERQYKAVIQRVNERGNDDEKMELVRFYGKAKIRAAMNASKTQPFALRQVNA